MQETTTTLDDLARMIANGFTDVTSRMATQDDVQDIKAQINILESGQEDIKLRLDSMAYKFEVKELTRRVDILEDKVGIAHA